MWGFFSGRAHALSRFFTQLREDFESELGINLLSDCSSMQTKTAYNFIKQCCQQTHIV
uniref:Uncharacterized protein n=1 Tax=Anguilla anguilla TaxID=7936 RepID=A0A0E9T003_ANGAN